MGEWAAGVRIAPDGSWLPARVCGSLALCFILFKKACALSAAKRHLKGIRLWSGCGGYAGAGRTFSFPLANIHRVWGRTRICARGQTHAPVSLPNGSIAHGHAGILYLLPSLTTAAQRDRGGTQDGSVKQNSRARDQRLAAAGLGQAHVAQPAKHGGTADRAGCGHVRDMRRPRGDRAPGANQPEIVTRTDFKAFNTTKRLLLNLNRLHHVQDGT